jgi:uncharacterized protein
VNFKVTGPAFQERFMNVAKPTVPKPLLALEFAVLLVLLPVAFRLLPAKVPPLPVLWLVSAYCLVVLWRDPTFSRRQLWNTGPLAANLATILGIFAGIAAFLATCVYLFVPHLLFEFVRQNPAFWAIVMLFYPVISVYPQSIVYRAFLMHRYQPLAPSPVALILLSAAAFGLMHIVFRNPVAVSLTALGGILFAWRYYQTRSLFVSSFEHALYGCFLFTIGLGRFFYAPLV